MLTGEWLPKTVADSIGRFSPATETAGPSPLVLESPEPARVSRRGGPRHRRSRTVGARPGDLRSRNVRSGRRATEPVLTSSVAGGAAATSTAAEGWLCRRRSCRCGAIGAPPEHAPSGPNPTGTPGGPSQRPADGVSRLRKWRWPISAAAAVIAIAVLARILAASPGGTPPPSASHTVTASSSTTSRCGEDEEPGQEAIEYTVRYQFFNPRPCDTHTPSPVADVGEPVRGTCGCTSYASDPLATGSSLVTARVYFGQLKAVVGALADQVTFNTPAAWVDEEPRSVRPYGGLRGHHQPNGRCVCTSGSIRDGEGWSTRPARTRKTAGSTSR